MFKLRLALWFPCLLLATSSRADSTVVFNEIMYHPPTHESAWEWVELHNQMAVDMELSGWRLAGGIEFAFPDGTIVSGGGYLVVALAPADLMAATGLTNVLGPFTGRLANNGERLELRNNNDRLMDATSYGVDGDWPVAPDGAGPSLAKLDEDTASHLAANWRASELIGGTPGARNFPERKISVTSSNAILVDSVWRYDDRGTDRGTDWRDRTHDDSAWASGAGLFYAGVGGWLPGGVQAIPGLFSTGIGTNGQALVPGNADPHYVLTASAYSSPPPPPLAATVVANHANWLANDVASVWIGPISQGTVSVPPGNYHYRTAFDLTGFDATTALITVQVAVDNDLTGVLLNGVNVGLAYSGFSTFSLPFTISSGFLPGTNTLDFLTVNTTASASPAGFRAKLSGTAFRRASTNTLLSLASTTAYFRKAFTFVGNPAAAALTLRTVADDGAVFYLNGVEVLRQNMPAGTINNTTPAVTNVGNANFTTWLELPIRGLVAGTNVLAVELHQAVNGTNDALFGAELVLTLTNFPPPLPPTLAFNEMSSVTNAQFWIELVNFGTQSVALDNLVLARFGTTNHESVLPPQTLPAGGYTLLDRALLGFGADPGDQVVLYRPDKSQVLDAIVAKRYARARWPEGTGAWLLPDQTTPGTTNQVARREEIVINEIMYHARDLPAVAAVPFTNTLITITNGWRYHQTGQYPGADWTALDYDDSLWSAGRAVFFTNITTLPAPKGTTLALSNAGVAVTTYYFRTPFVFTNDPTGLQLTVNPIIDDGAIFYLNGEEVYRYGMPTGAVTSATRASLNVGVPTFSGPVSIPADRILVGTNLLAVEVHQYLPPPGSRDVAFAAELVGTGFVTPALPARLSPESWLELYNRATNPVDLTGWRLADGINYEFPPGTTLAPDSYLVVAKDPGWMATRYPGLDVLGPFTNRLSRGGESILLLDAIGNPADRVRYRDDRPWPSYADGGGSSLELRDPRSDNSRPEAWAASAAGTASTWQTYMYHGVAAAEPAASPTQWKEFVLGLLGEGEVLLDDLSVIESPGGTKGELLQNGSFESGLTAWRIIGTHRRSEVIVDPANPGNHVLRLVATGETEHMHNHAETTLANGAAIVNGTEYQISFRARWIAGCHKLNTRLYFNRLARTTLLEVPAAGGTPGTRNSTFAANLGPTFANLRHAPVVPATSEPVGVAIEASDPDGVATARLFYAVNGGAWQSVAMNTNAAPESALLSGTLPAQAAGSVVQFYVSATDTRGAVATYPAGGANARALYQVNDSALLMPRLHRLRLVMTPGDAAWLHELTNVMSNDRLGCTIIYDEREVFYDARLHLQASERGRPVTTRVGFTVKFPTDHLFRGIHGLVTIDRSGGYSGKGGRQDEILLKHAVNKAGGLPGMYDDLVQCLAPRSQEDSTALLLMAKFNDVFLDSQFPNGSDGEKYKLEIIYYPTTTTTGDPQAPKLPQPDSVLDTDLGNLGGDPEAYRWNLLKENHVARDNYDPLIALAQAMSLTGTNLEQRLPQVMDVDEWMRAVAFLGLIGADDMYTYGHAHNLQIYFRPDDLKGMALLWDLDFAFVAATAKAFPGSGSATTYKIITTIPDNYRRYCHHLFDLSNTTGDTAYLTRWANHYASLVGQNWSGAVAYLAERAAYVRGTLPLTTPFTISNNSGHGFATPGSTVQLTGTAPITVRDIAVNGLRHPLTWTSLTTWTLTVPLPAYTNWLAVQGLDSHQQPLTNATSSILITNLGVPPILPVVINEWMADNAGVGGYPDPADGQFQDWFELYNPNAIAVDLSGYFLTDTLAVPNKWSIPTNTVIAPHSFLLVWADENGSQNGTGTNGDLHASFKLGAGGEALGLFAPDGTRLHAVAFGPQLQNVSQGLFPDGNTNAIFAMSNWTPHSPNQLGSPAAPAILTTTLGASGTLNLTVAAPHNRVCRLECKNDLDAPVWFPLQTNRAATGLLTIIDNTAAQPQRFYRVVLLP